MNTTRLQDGGRPPDTDTEGNTRGRVVIVITFSRGALEMVKARVLPSASVSGGSSRVMSTNCPARYDQSAGRSNRKDIVRSATVSRLASLVLKNEPVVLIVRSRMTLRPRQRFGDRHSPLCSPSHAPRSKHSAPLQAAGQMLRDRIPGPPAPRLAHWSSILEPRHEDLP
jgi:hypothetical protein